MSDGSDITDYQSFDPNNLLVSVTRNYGATWSAPVRIGQDPPNPRWTPWLAYSPTGALGVSCRSKYGAGACLVPEQCPEASYDELAAISPDRSIHLGQPVRISHARSAAQIDSGTGLAAGDDYGHVALDEKYLSAAWGDMRRCTSSTVSGAQRSVYLGRVPIRLRRTR